MTELTKIGSIVNKRPNRKNIIVNGSMSVKQSPTGDMPDKWYFRDDGISGSDNYDTDTPDGNSHHSLWVRTSVSANSVGASERHFVRTGVEGFDFAPLVGNYGTLSFWAKSNVTGVHSVVLKSSGADKNYVGEYTIGSADTWERHVITIDFTYTGGTWDYTDGLGLKIDFTLTCGSTYRTSNINTWITDNIWGSSNHTDHYSVENDYLNLTQVQLELGGNETDFEVISDQEELMKCQRYYQEIDGGCGGAADAAGDRFSSWIQLRAPMRTTPSIGRGLVSDVNAGHQYYSSINNDGWMVWCDADAVGTVEKIYRFRCSADVTSANSL